MNLLSEERMSLEWALMNYEATSLKTKAFFLVGMTTCVYLGKQCISRELSN